MKKVLAILMALVLAVACTAALAEEEPGFRPAPDPDHFSGIWECERASIEITWEEEGYRVLIEWNSSALETTTWEYSCLYHEENDTIVSTPFGIRTEIVFDENSDDVTYTQVYDDGTATFSIDEEGHLIWLDEKENAGEGMLFDRIGDLPEIIDG